MSRMLRSFVGTFDAVGLRTLKSEDEVVESQSYPIAYPPGSVPFWAILEISELPSIHQALMQGSPDRAWELLVHQAKCIGRWCA